MRQRSSVKGRESWRGKGGDGLRRRVVKLVKQTLAVGKTASYIGPAKQPHGPMESQTKPFNYSRPFMLICFRSVDNLRAMKELEELKTAVEREIERARRNMDDLHAVQESVWLNLAKLRALRDEAEDVCRYAVGTKGRELRLRKLGGLGKSTAEA